MRYGPEHKARTRRRILREARRLFRRDGYDGVSLDAVMSAAGLTRGGFYKHFGSKADLFAEATAGEADFVRRLKAREGANRAALARGALEVVSGYLHPANRERVGRGCDLAALSVDVARSGVRARRHHTAKVRALLDELERGLPDARTPDPRALVSVALCVGGLTVARALTDPDLAEALLGACRDAAERELLG
ncbi:MAG TPA: TetR/AcrR family transcriptional regulator [Myxococcota bacterium]|nr:TetR/AcrR family transcriptional regulator [Myxococcota bacterium]